MPLISRANGRSKLTRREFENRLTRKRPLSAENAALALRMMFPGESDMWRRATLYRENSYCWLLYIPADDNFNELHLLIAPGPDLEHQLRKAGVYNND